MKIAYRAEINDLAEAQLRLFNRSKVARRNKYFLLYGVPLFLVVILTIGSENPLVGLASALVVAIPFFILVIVFYPKLLARRQRNYLREALGERDAVAIEVEFDSEGFKVRQEGTEISINWTEVTEVVENNQDFEIRVAKRGLGVIRRKNFDSPERYQECLELVRQRAKLA